ncbi:hypothetical protein CLV84_1809 [Neolewinella xylanilytica]|uniref:Uncharacterized protein n=1 Tax=Neolewinella xylanilytica TaxID=1514080 RepID=A0A2S6IBJ7_9BACT|nr:hypothetical protein [Neolewinella xylanilytica]PPK88836.1 hypothetical protein CLV84_1809 [Neolewinella xylanilytica]
MKEKNYQTLRDALDRLPRYEGDARCWSAIKAMLDDAAEGATARLADRLPTYAPPPAVWNGVNKGLDVTKRAPVRRLPRRWASMAAAVAVVVSFSVVFLTYNPGPEVSYAYSRETAPPPVVADWDNDETSFNRARLEVAQRNEPHLNNLGHELDELTSAREEVKAMLVAYGEDPGIVRQLAEIERERNDVYRRIIVEL